MGYIIRLSMMVAMLCLGMSAQARHLLVSGTVTAGGKALGGVVVSDGFKCFTTDANGYYTFEADDDARFVFVSTPSGFTAQCKDGTIPQFYQRLDRDTPKERYDFELVPTGGDDNRFAIIAQADVQVTQAKELRDSFSADVADMSRLATELRQDGRSVFSIDLGDIVGNVQGLYPQYIKTIAPLQMPVYRAIGNHDMEIPAARTYEGSMKTFEGYFGPVNYSFNRGKAHVIVTDDCFCMGRDYQYIGYVPEQTFRWLEEDLSHVSKNSLVFVAMHIPSNDGEKLVFNKHDMENMSNAAAFWELLKGYDTHILSGHTHWNQNIVYGDSLYEHNTAAVCGIWWKADVCMDGTPRGCGVYEVDGDKAEWYYHSFGKPKSYQLRAYAVGSSKEHPGDIIANVWNYDKKWKVEWLEDGKVMGKMKQFTGFDPEAAAICADKKRVEYDWISPVKTSHMFHATPKNPNAKITVRATDRFGNVYKADINKK